MLFHFFFLSFFFQEFLVYPPSFVLVLASFGHKKARGGASHHIHYIEPTRVSAGWLPYGTIHVTIARSLAVSQLSEQGYQNA